MRVKQFERSKAVKNLDLSADRVRRVCNISSNLNVDGVFWASSYQYHPHGFLRNGILAYDRHNINGYIDIEIAEDPDCEWTKHGDDSLGSFNPLPKPKGCKTVRVWSLGKWLKEGPWQERIIREIEKIEAEYDAAQARHDARVTEEKKQAQSAKAEKEAQLKKAWA